MSSNVVVLYGAIDTALTATRPNGSYAMGGFGKLKWDTAVSLIFNCNIKDYHKLKPRKSNDRRQRFLVAMRHCPFIELLDDISSKEEKFYKFRAYGTLSVNATDEIAALSALNQHHETDEIPSVPPALSGPPIVSATDDIAVLSALNQRVEMEEIPSVPTAENGPPIGNTSMEDIACDSQPENGMIFFSV
ncbi:unnamed protein product [Larinioides sclopetarius]|uniref:Uncharacterized protein n=1 Tax=Larinioides sclopetarius TaxID=280406 RepID=A0AAV2B767_9ARAC